MRLQLWCLLPCSSPKLYRHARMKDGVLIQETSRIRFRHQMVCLKWHAPFRMFAPESATRRPAASNSCRPEICLRQADQVPGCRCQQPDTFLPLSLTFSY